MRLYPFAAAIVACTLFTVSPVHAGGAGCSSCGTSTSSGCSSCGSGKLLKRGIPIPIIGLGLFHHAPGGHPQDWVNCECSGQYNYPVPPQYTYHWPGMFKQTAMTDYHSPWRFPPIKPYYDEPSPGEAEYGLGIAEDRAAEAEEAEEGSSEDMEENDVEEEEGSAHATDEDHEHSSKRTTKTRSAGRARSSGR